MRIELGSQKLPPNIIPVVYESQLLCAFTIDQAILGKSNALIKPLKGALYRIWCGLNRLGDSGVKVV